ncbi:MAG: hypothetical protein J5595_03315 [Bacteroidales bacterium]|nr:hypothetical protein [Bacteroidales bacterium]
MKKLFTALCFVLVASLSCLAQETYTWKKENIKVILPAGMKVVDDDGDGKITVASKQATLQLMASLNQDLDDEDKAAGLLVKIANNIDLNMDDYDTDEFECVGGTGYYIIGEHKTSEKTAIAGMAWDTAEDRYMLVVALFYEDAAESVGRVLGGLNFPD